MNRYLLVIVLSIVFTGCAVASSNSSTIVQQSIGKLLVLHDQKFSYQDDDNPFGAAILFEEFKQVFNSQIKSLPVRDRIDFLWAAMWHMDFDGHSMMQFQEIVAKDCGEEFVSKLESYIEKESSLKRNKRRLHLSEKVLFGIKQIMGEESK